MVRAIPLDTPRPPKCHLKLWEKTVFVKNTLILFLLQLLRFLGHFERFEKRDTIVWEEGLLGVSEADHLFVLPLAMLDGGLALTTAKKEPRRAQKNTKTAEQLNKSTFSQKLFFHYFKLNLGGLGMSGGRGWTIRRDCLELWPGLV